MPYIPPTLPRKAKPHQPSTSTSTSINPSTAATAIIDPSSSSSLPPSTAGMASSSRQKRSVDFTPSPSTPPDPTIHLASNLSHTHLLSSSPAELPTSSTTIDQTTEGSAEPGGDDHRGSLDNDGTGEDEDENTRRQSTSSASAPSLMTATTASNSTSTSSLKSLSDGEALMMSGMTTTPGSEDAEGAEEETPGTSVGVGEGMMGLAEAERRYKEGLYAYTRNLYLQAQLSSERSQKSDTSQFGTKQSGMEKMAKKKALAKLLNA